jgi:hypothetical protein
MTQALEQTDAEDNVIHVARWFVEDSRAELRRLHAVNAELLEALDEIAINTHDDIAERDARAAIAAWNQHAALAQPEQDLQLVANFLKEYGLEVLEVIAALKEQPEQEPEPWMGVSDNPYASDADCNDPNGRAMRWHNKLQAMIAQPEQEPAAWLYEYPNSRREKAVGFYPSAGNGVICTPLYAHPPQRKPLTPEEILALFESHNVYGDKSVNWLCRVIEAEHGIGGEHG